MRPGPLGAKGQITLFGAAHNILGQLFWIIKYSPCLKYPLEIAAHHSRFFRRVGQRVFRLGPL